MLLVQTLDMQIPIEPHLWSHPAIVLPLDLLHPNQFPVVVALGQIWSVESKKGDAHSAVRAPHGHELGLLLTPTVLGPPSQLELRSGTLSKRTGLLQCGRNGDSRHVPLSGYYSTLYSYAGISPN